MERAVAMCQCGHSEGAHRGERCGFCYCPRFTFESTRHAAGWRDFERGDVSLREAAQRLGLQVATLRRAIHEGQLPASKVGNRWRVTLHDAMRFASAEEVIPKSKKARAHMAERVAFNDFLGRLWADGAGVTEPYRPGTRTPQQSAERLAIDVHLGNDGHRPSVPDTKKARARVAQQKAIDDMVRHFPRRFPPQRSL